MASSGQAKSLPYKIPSNQWNTGIDNWNVRILHFNHHLESWLFSWFFDCRYGCVIIPFFLAVHN